MSNIQSLQKVILKDYKTSADAFVERQTAAGGFLKAYTMSVETLQNKDNPTALLQDIHDEIEQILNDELHELNGIKYQLIMSVKLKKLTNGFEEFTTPHLVNKQSTLLQNYELNDSLTENYAKIIEKLERWTQNGSGWIIEQVSTITINVAKYQPLKGGSYIPTPKKLAAKKLLVT